MKVALSAALLLAATASAQAPPKFTDPANLRGERVAPRTGRELPIDQGAPGLQQMLRKLNTRASLMLIVAHPDDEDGGMLTLLSRGLGARVATLTLTRGEGGQNAMTGDFEDALGLIRTQELLLADSYFGADQFFGTEVDFGFSKTKEEAFRKWTHERVLYDAVRSVRLYRPLVLAAVFLGGVTDGHGQHQVSGQIAQEVFNAAGDPKVFPELTAEGILPWQPLKVYARVPAFAITDKGLFDYATGQYAPARFTNYVTGETTTTPPSVDVTVHEGQTDPLLNNGNGRVPSLATDHANPSDFYTAPLSYVQFARLGLGLQKTQIGPGVRLATPGAFDVGYHLYGTRLCTSSPQERVILSGAQSAQSKDPCLSPVVATSAKANADPRTAGFFDGIDTSLAGIATLSPAPPAFLSSSLSALAAKIAQATQASDAAHERHPDYVTLQPETVSAVAPLLADALRDLDTLLVRTEATPFRGREDVLHELRVKRVQLNDALTITLGLSMFPEGDDADQIAGEPVQEHTHLVQGSPGAVSVHRLWSTNSAGEAVPGDSPTLNGVSALALGHPVDPLCHLPAQKTPITRPYFLRDNIEQPVYRLLNPSLRNAPGTPAGLTCWAEVQYRDVPLQLGTAAVDFLVPGANVRLYAHAQLLASGQHEFLTRGVLGPDNIPLRSFAFTLPPGWTATRVNPPSSYFEYRVTAPATAPAAPVTLRASATLADGSRYTEGYLPVGYPGVQRTNFYTPADLRVVPADLKLPTHRRIGYVPGTGDSVVPVLISLGLQPETLSVEDLTPARLARFDSVVLGVRTYNAHPELHGAPTQALLDFARNGGNVIVQYQTAEFTTADAPYPITLGNAEKVVDETAPVRLLHPESVVLSTPNRITEADFQGWIEERGHGFLHTWDPHYTALTETHDPGVPAEDVAPQLPQEGGLITTSLGRGHWTYCAFALYRQLPEAVPGAVRLFANLLGLADSPSK